LHSERGLQTPRKNNSREKLPKVSGRYRQYSRPVCVGGPDVSCSPHLYADADFQVIGEAEQIMVHFIAAWERGERKGVFIGEKFKIDVTLSPMPRYDLIKFDHYLFELVGRD